VKATIAWGLAVAVVATSAVGYATRATGRTARVEAGPIAERVIADARVVPIAGVALVTATEGGRALRVLLREGDRVEAGQLLAEIGPEDKPVRVTAPIAGVVLARRIDVGDSVSPLSPAPLFEIADVDATELRVEVDESSGDRVTPNLEVHVVGQGGAPKLGEAVVRAVAPRVEPRASQVDDGRSREGFVRVVWATWKGARPKLPIGAHVEAVIVRASRDVAARVPRCAATVRDGHGVVDERVWLWKREVPVELGATDDAFVEVRGAPLGATVVCP
jgi:multidrug efflux pump subunit AcrA (membrane-fusion protein)